MLAVNQQQVAPPQASQVDEHSAWCCPLCGGPMIFMERFTAQQISVKAIRKDPIDTS
jgi:transposase